MTGVPKTKRNLFFPTLALILTVTLASCTLVEVNLGPRRAPFEEHTLSGQGQAKVLLVELSGFMMVGSGGTGLTPWSGREDMIARLSEELGRAREDPDVKALVVRINSPGGAVAAADILHHLILDYKKETGAKVVASLTSVAASGGYYAALAADRIVVLPTTVTGSIGVISLRFDVSGLMGLVGVEAEAVKSAPLKDMWSPFRPADEEERRVMQEVVDELYDRFKDALRAGRPQMTEDQFKRAVTGRIFTARQALELGLADQVAYPEQAFALAKEMAGLTEARLIVYHRPGGYRESVYAKGPDPMVRPDWSDALALLSAPQFMYLWLPGLGQ